MSWQNRPLDWHMDENKALTISAGAKTDWFVDPFDGTGAIAKFSEIAYDPQRVGNIYK